MKRKHILPVVIILLISVSVFAGYNAIRTYLDYEDADALYEDIQNKYVQTVPDDTGSPEVTTGGESSGDETTGEEPQPSETVPDEPVPVKISVDFDALLQENKDIVGWIYCEDTPISYPVVQGKDNNQYLRADLKGKYLVSGTIFVDYRNGEPGSDRNYIIYGHNMKNSTMFGTLVKYKQQAYYDAHPTITYLTPNGNYTIELIAGLVVNMTDIIYQANPSEDEFTAYLTKALEKSTFDSGLTFSEDDTLVTLSTCSYEFDNARYVVIGRLVANN